ncbi:MAG: tail fiber domain-containing protein [Bacteroidales bacterium]
MKAIQKISVMCLSLMISTSFAQIKVSSNGNVGVQLGTSTPLSPFALGGVGSASYLSYIGSSYANTLLRVEKNSPSSSGTTIGVDASVMLNYGAPSYNYGIKGQSYSSSYTSVARAYGVLGLAGNGYCNYGVFGQLSGTANGAAVVGMITSSSYPEVAITGRYAGYFVGEVITTAPMYAPAFIVSSDKRYKDNITSLDQPKSLKGILGLNPVEYNLKQFYTKGRKDSVEVDVPYYDEKSQLFTKKHYGLIAQEIQAIYPDLVYTKDDGYLAVDYIGIIPMLIQSVKELSAKVDALSGNGAKLRSAVADDFSGINLPCQLYQNAPNPFSTSTIIKYSLSNEITAASILIFDMQGKLLKTEPLKGTGEGSITIHSSSLSPGMYIYALVANGKEIDTKRMILTK